MKPRSFLRRLRCFSFRRSVKMHHEEEQEPPLHRELKHLMVARKNEELKLKLEGTHPSDWVFNNGYTLLHLAVIYNNLDLIKYLLNTGYDIEAKNSYGNTTLLIALDFDRFEAATILVDADANVCVIDSKTGKTPLGLLMTKSRESVKGIVPHFSKNLKRRKLDADTLVDLVLASNWPLDFVMSMNDVEVSRKFLQRNNTGNRGIGMKIAIKKRDLDHLQLILQYGNHVDKLLFYSKLSNLFTNHKTDSWTFLIKNLSHCVDITEWSLREFNVMFMSATMEYLQVLLDYKIHVMIQRKFGKDMRTCIFGNKKVDAVELRFRKQDFLEDFNVNARGIELQTALHYAVKENLTYNIRFLLNSGADVNAKNYQGQTALFDCMHRNNTGQLLLEHGADVQVVDNKGLTVFELAQMKNPVLLDFLVAQLAIDHVQDIPIKQIIKNQIESNNHCRRTFETCCQQLKLLKAYEISNTITLFTVLTTKFATPYRFLCDQNHIFLLDKYKDQHGLHLFYYSTMKEKIIKLLNLYHFTCDVSHIISKDTGQSVDFDHLVVKKISDYLTERDLQEYIISVTMLDV